MDQPSQKLSPENKRAALFESWLSPPAVAFKGPEAEKAYKRRVNRIKDAIELKQTPDRVPVFPFVGFFPAFYDNITPREAMYDYAKLYDAWKKYVLDFKPDAHPGSFLPGPGKFFDRLDYKLYAWPGHGTEDHFSYQCLEDEYVKPDEYDALIRDPSHYFNSTYMPRIFGRLEAYKNLPPLTGVLELPFTALSLAPYGDPEVQAAYKSFLDAALEASKWAASINRWDKEMASRGFPNMFGGFSKAPFDVIGDTLRGSKGIILDMYRQPDKLIEALDALVPFMIELGLSGARKKGNPIVFIPLHKGDDQFMSQEQYETFYWPSLKRVLLGLIEEGCVPFSYAEGRYNARLEMMREIPRGTSIWAFDQTDMAKAKQFLADIACIGGNMPSTLLCFGTTKEVEYYTKNLIDTAAADGGYILITGAVLDEARPANVQTMIEIAKAYGTY